jgi:ATP-dependent exoDNAse (exonuclease V) alpha subunit
LASVIGYAGPGKSAMLGVAREVWERGGYRVRGAALSGIAAENLEGESGIGSRTIASLEHAWEQGRDPLTRNDILVVDEAGMIGTRQMERVLSHAREAGATLPNRSADKQHRHGGAMSHKHHEYGKAANHPK